MHTIEKTIEIDPHQIAIEEEMRRTSIDTYRRNIDKAKERGAESTTLYGVNLMKHSVVSLSSAIVEFLEYAFAGRAGKTQTSAELLNLVDPEKAAYLTLKVVMDGVSNKYALTKVGMRIANVLEDEVKFGVFESKDKGWFQVIRNEVTKRTSNRQVRRYALIHTMNRKALIDFSPWSHMEKLMLGCKLIDLLIRSTGIVELRTQTYSKTKRTLYVVATDKTLDWIEKVNSNGELLSPFYLPCIVPPKDWTSPTEGGYHTESIRPLNLIKTFNRRYLDEMANCEMPMEYKAVNALQQTKWAVNTRVLDVMQTAWDSGQPWKGIPAREDLTLPPSPCPDLKKEDMDEVQKHKFLQWKAEASKIHQANSRTTSKRVQFSRTLSLAGRFRDTPFYFPYQTDFRGRKYTVVSFLSPQGASFSKALLTFCDALPIEDREQESWLAVHGANCFGYDKASLEDRHSWALDHTPEIIASAEDPYNNRFWLDADEPWMFLAFCFEWAGFCEEGYGYMSSLPIGLDGSNNGLQHFSAMLRDEVAGAATNLMPSDKPQDIYQTVADKVVAALKQKASKGDEEAKKWLEFGVNRKTCKRPVMVLPYGGQKYSCRQYIEDYIRERVEGGATNPWDTDLFKPSLYLTDFVWEAIGETVTSAREAMSWIQDQAKLVAKLNLPLIWTSPTGFVVQQHYPSMIHRRIKTYIDNTIVKPSVNELDFANLDKRRSVNGASPNFVHALDAAAMTITICKAVDLGIRDYAMIHDSYGVHAHHTPKLATALREAFVEMYTNHDPLEEYRQSILQVVDEVPPPPKRGNLDISKVLDSAFFFS